MTVIRPNSISGITSITAQSGTLEFYDATGSIMNVTGDVTGNVTGNLTGNVTGNLTGNVNSTGISTLGNTLVGGATTQLVVNGDARITGILTIGTGSITFNDTTNTISGVNIVKNTNGVDITPRIIQVVTSKWDVTGSGNAYITSGTYTDSGASASITPKINGSTIIITVNGRLGSSYGSYIDHYWIIRDNAGNNLPGYTNALQYIERLQTGSGTSYMFMQAYHENVSGAQTYKLYGAQAGGTGIYIFQPVIFTLMEVMV